MRTMDLPKVTPPSDYEDAVGRYRARLSARIRVPSALSQLLLAYMAWPNDKGARDSWTRSIIAQRLAHRGKLSTGEVISAYGGLEGIAREVFDSAGGRLAAVMTKWVAAADVMQMLVDLHFSRLALPGGASLSKAMEVCADDKLADSVGHMRRHWGQFRDVAHLLAAGALIAREGSQGEGSIFSAAWYAPDSLLAIAAGYESFGLDFGSHGQRESILPTGTIWRVPPHLIPEKPWLQHRALDERQIEVLAGYKATKSYIARGAD